MTTGYPNLVTRDQLGPQFRDVYPVENPQTDLGADQLNLAFHQLAGHCLATPVRATVIGRYSTAVSGFVLDHCEEAWNPDHAQAHPVLARVSAGSYTLTFPATVLARDGASATLSLVAVRATGAAVAFTDSTKRVVQITGTDDVQFWVEVV